VGPVIWWWVIWFGLCSNLEKLDGVLVIAVVRTGLVLGLMFLMIMFPRVMVMVKYVLNQFAFSESSAKALLLLLFLAVLSGLRPFKTVWRVSWNRWFATGLVALYGLTLAEFLYYCRLFGLPLNQRSVLIYDGLQTSTRLEHIHNGKAILSALIPYQGQGFDVGAPFQAVYPNWLLLLQGLLFLVVCTMSVFLVHHYQKEWTPERTLFLALGLFALVKGVVDGGPFELATAGRLALMSIVLLKGRTRQVVLTLALGLVGLGLFLEAEKGLYYNLVILSVAVVGLGLPLLFEQARRQRSASAVGGFALALIFFLGAPLLKYQMSTYHRSTASPVGAWVYGNSSLKEGWTVHVVSRGDLPATDVGVVLSANKANRLQVSQLKLERDTTPFELCRLFRLNAMRSPVVWFQQPGYVVIEGRFGMPDPAKWLDNKIVLRYAYSVKDDWTTLVLELIPGAQTNVACDLLPPGPFPTSRVELVYTQPQVSTDWIEVPR
jgi:hypothetical protein